MLGCGVGGRIMKCIRCEKLMACLLIVVEGLCALVFAGCAGATRMPSCTDGTTGTTIQKNDIDMAFLQSRPTR
jgi:hypothetical protein